MGVTYLITVNAGLLTDDEMRFSTGWGVVGLIAINMIANFINIFKKMIEDLLKDGKEFCNEYCCRDRNRRKAIAEEAKKTVAIAPEPPKEEVKENEKAEKEGEQRNEMDDLQQNEEPAEKI